ASPRAKARRGSSGRPVRPPVRQSFGVSCGFLHPCCGSDDGTSSRPPSAKRAANTPNLALRAEGPGFEPGRPLTRPNGFQDRRIQPLCHPSESLGCYDAAQPASTLASLLLGEVAERLKALAC